MIHQRDSVSHHSLIAVSEAFLPEILGEIQRTYSILSGISGMNTLQYELGQKD